MDGSQIQRRRGEHEDTHLQPKGGNLSHPAGANRAEFQASFALQLGVLVVALLGCWGVYELSAQIVSRLDIPNVTDLLRSLGVPFGGLAGH